jgi:putative Mg2+ transporter-C (MgtC) family protein
MPLHPTWQDIAVRLILTVVAGALLGFDREAKGHAAGLRTTTLVCLAASVAMIQANLLLPTVGKASESFAVMDVMRLPLGILTGVGFIGGGAILRRGDLITGVTTAATLWMATVVGLCFGGGQLGVGACSVAISFVVLRLLKWVDTHIMREQRMTLVVATAGEGALPEEVAATIQSAGYSAQIRRHGHNRETGRATTTFDIQWRGPKDAVPPLAIVSRLEETYPITSVEWTSLGLGASP